LKGLKKGSHQSSIGLIINASIIQRKRQDKIAVV
jgi:hypothetical protein